MKLKPVNIKALIITGKLTSKYYVHFEKPISIIKDSINLSNKAILITLSFVLIVGSILSYFFALMFTRPILKINKKTTEIANLDFESELSIKNKDEIGDLGTNVNNISIKLKNSLNELKESNIQLDKDRKDLKILNKKLVEISQTDPLTKLSNRLKVDQILKEELYKSEFRGKTFSVIIMDIDHFKQVNDIYGHQTGDEVLIEFAEILKQNSRQIDLVGRWGGEEFILILPDTNIEGALSMAGNIRDAINSFSFSKVGEKTASFGVGEYQKGYDLKSIIKMTDEALYLAKENGRNRIENAKYCVN